MFDLTGFPCGCNSLPENPGISGYLLPCSGGTFCLMATTYLSIIICLK
uniref:Uncharacterized protein n=1 Tax=Ascaris lumbricoides TaxID=6252 RepID=A0A9J2PQT1_ASCLU